MSGLGISPSDLVAGGKAIGKAISAVRDGGSKYTFQEADDSVRDRIAASKLVEEHFAISDPPLPSSAALVRAAKQLRTRDEIINRKHDNFKGSLGPNATSTRRRQVGSALKWAFKGEKDFAEHNDRNLNTIDHGLKSWFEGFADGINKNIVSTFGKVDERAQTISTHVSEALTKTLKRTHDGQRDLVQNGFSDSQRQLQTVVTKLEDLENRITALSPQTATGPLSVELVRAFLIRFWFCWHRNDTIRIFSQNLMSDALKNPPSCILLCFTLFLFLKLHSQIPLRLCLGGGDVVHFEDALGTTYNVPFATFEHVKIFKAFLEVKFEGRPGFAKVVRGECNMLLAESGFGNRIWPVPPSFEATSEAAGSTEEDAEFFKHVHLEITRGNDKARQDALLAEEKRVRDQFLIEAAKKARAEAAAAAARVEEQRRIREVAIRTKARAAEEEARAAAASEMEHYSTNNLPPIPHRSQKTYVPAAAAIHVASSSESLRYHDPRVHPPMPMPRRKGYLYQGVRCDGVWVHQIRSSAMPPDPHQRPLPSGFDTVIASYGTASTYHNP
ncbi:hypothetical protein H2200_012665 [Cladophialophora chaetospira]|uniref:Ubiquitin-like domain-containing protein n=1 Tax=Cladophialophora chaetospira TaxID=386627 RepID=A0AA39CC77_9EURO|nr:hypothetical protein H2200_012665 [Cladophialophora chaetospira]